MPTLNLLLTALEGFLRLRGIKRRKFQDGELEVSYLEYGRRDAPNTLVLVHGLGSSAHSWVKVIPKLGRDFHVLVPDLPGWGFSPLPAGKDHATIHDLMDALTRFLDHMPHRSVILVGQSLGGWVSAKVAANRPDRVSQLVLCNSAGVLYPEVADLKAKMDVKDQADVANFWKNMWHRVPGFYRFFREDYVKKMHEPRILNFFESIREESTFVNQDLHKITMPTTILWGLSDRFIPIHTVDVLVAGLRDVTVYWIPECGHIPALERPNEVVRLFRARLLPARVAQAPIVTSA